MVALAGAETDRLLGSWGIDVIDPNDAWSQGGPIIGDRGLWLYDNDPIAHAIVESLLAGAIGPTGLRYRSLYSEDDLPESTPEERQQRREINGCLKRATHGRRFDAAGLMTRADMTRTIARQSICTGAGFSQRLWKPDRPGRQVQATCWRLIHSSRVSNPAGAPNSDTLVNGFELNGDGTPVAIHVQKGHPAAAIGRKQEWVRIPLYAPDGSAAVTYLPSFTQPDQIRGPGWFNQVIPLLRFLGRTLEAKVIADLMKASIGFIIECDDPAAMARQDRNGAILTQTTKIKPGMKYYVKKGTTWKEFNLQFNGADFQQWGDFLLKLICANFQIPFEFVLQQLTQTNLAASRVALIQAYKTFHGLQEWLINYVEEPWNQSVIQEDLARGRIKVKSDDLDRIFAGRYLRPARPFPDPVKEATAGVIRNQQLAVSLSTIHSEQGSDLEDEVAAGKVDQETLAANGIRIAPMNGQPQPDGAVDEPEQPAPARAPAKGTP